MAAVTLRERNSVQFWEARVTLKGHPARSKSFPHNKKKKAIEWGADLEAQLRGGAKISVVPGKTKIADLIEDYMAARVEWDHDGYPTLNKRGDYVWEISPTTLNSLRRTSQYIGELTVEELTSMRVEAWIKRLKRTKVPKQKRAPNGKAHKLYDGDSDRCYSGSGIRKLYHALKEAVVWHAREHDYEIGKRFEGFKLPAAWGEPRNRRLPTDEEERLLKACDGMYRDPEGWKLLIRLALATAMRAGELLQLKWSEVKRERKFIGIPKARTKTKMARAVPLGAEGRAVIQALWERRDDEDGRVFWTMPTKTTILGRSFKAITKRAGLADLRFHDLRHEATARLFERTSMRQLEISLVTGHSSPNVLQRYADLRPEFLLKQLERRGELTAL